MRIGDLLQFSINSLFKRKFRTFLTVLGVMIGTISIVVMISLGIGMKASILQSMDQYGSVKMILVNFNEYDNNNVDDKDKKFLDDELVSSLEGIEHVETVVPAIKIPVIIATGRYNGYGTITGISKEGFDKLGIKISKGTGIGNSKNFELIFGNMVLSSFYEKKSNFYPYYEKGEMPDVDVLNDNFIVYLDTERFYSQGSADSNGNTVAPPKKHKTIVSGVIEGEFEEWNAESYNIYCNIDVLINELKKEFKNRPIPGQPLKKTGKPYKEIYYSEIKVFVDNIENVKDVQTIINNMGYQTYADAEWISSEMNTMNIIQLVLGGIGGVSLFVAAIGITNTMSMSIYERTKEIGIMKVIGCKIRDIQAMFLIEAGFIGFLGGVSGLLISYLLSFLMNRFLVDVMSEMGFNSISIIPWWLSVASVIFAVIIGMVAGFFPSVRAMRLSPLTAIRNE